MGGAALDVVVLGLSLSSSWGNGHATTYRALLKAFAERGHRVTFLEREQPWYAGNHQDLRDPAFCELIFYRNRTELGEHCDRIRAADVVIVGSYVPDGVEVATWVQANANGVVAFYDIDTPVTLAKLARGDEEYLSKTLIGGFDLYLSFTGGPTLQLLEALGAGAARALYCSVDADRYVPRHRPSRWDLSYLGTYSDDRQPMLDRLLLEPARRAPDLHFVVAGPQYPAGLVWPANVERLEHVAPADHPEFYAQSRYTLNVTRADMVAAGFSPSVRLFEASACGTPIISDFWEGLDILFKPDVEIVIATDAERVLEALYAPQARRAAMAQAAHARLLDGHTARHRAAEFEAALLEAVDRRRA